MNTPIRTNRALIATAVAALLLGACSTTTKPAGADNVRSKLTQLQSDPQLASRALVAITDAEAAVRAAEEPRSDKDLEKHLVFIADRKVDIATARAQGRLLEDQRKLLSEQREGARLDSRTREADNARTDADIARNEAAAANMAAEAARDETDDLQQQIAALNAKETDRGLVVTLGDVLFATGKAELKGGVISNLNKLSTFLNKYQDRTVIIEGHTDSVGSEDTNLGLSQRRADSVKSYLVSQGIAPTRLAATGMGEGSPVSGNDSATGRQQNRRVDVIIANTVPSSR
ncbi:MAG: OmpA family protein [Porticoccaceae bacterium]